MPTEWLTQDTTTHQDHVIAHVVGATVLGYFILDEALYILLDIGFIWKIYVDGEMGLLPHPVAVGELEADEATRAQISTEIDRLMHDTAESAELKHLKPSPANCLIEDVSCYMNGDLRRILLVGEAESLVIHTSLSSGEIRLAGI
jgi:hypothetical protein